MRDNVYSYHTLILNYNSIRDENNIFNLKKVINYKHSNKINPFLK